MKKKIVLIGPVYPYKGGISHYTGMMYRSLALKHDVEMISYKMQYPHFLFHKEQRDYENKKFEVPKTRYLIHTANPFNLIRTARYIRRLKADIVLIQWWHPYFAPCDWILAKFMGKQNLVYVCHNVFPHERFPMDRQLTKLALRSGKHFIVHSEEEGRELCELMSKPDFCVTPHPTYEMFRMEGIGKEEARKRLGMGQQEKALLFFGFVREYKGLKYLLNAMPKIINNITDVRLLVVGDFDGGKDIYLQMIHELDIEAHVTVKEGYVPDEQVEPYFAACDLVTLPYESATQSGIVQIAYGFCKPVIVTDVGGLPEVVENSVTGYVIPPCDSEALADAVIRFYQQGKEQEFTENIKRRAERFSWDRMREVVERFM